MIVFQQIQMTLFTRNFINYFPKMGNCGSESDKVLSRGRIDLVYSTTSGTSRGITNKLQEVLEDNKYLANVINIGDYDYEDLLDSCGTVIFLLSTYGDGASPSDGQKFYQWILGPTLQERFKNLSYSIIAFGNSSFENHCGFGLKTQKFLKAGGAKQLLEITLCDASSKEKDSEARFPAWSAKLVEILNSQHQLQMIDKSNLGSNYQAVVADDPNNDWQRAASGYKNVRKEFSSFFQMYKAKVIEIKELRKGADKDRSTLHIRLQIDKSVKMWPACNVEVFPINTDLQPQQEDNFIVTFNQVKGKLPFPPMPLRQIRKIVNYSQTATNRQIKAAILLSQGQEKIINEYKNKTKESDSKTTCKKLVEDLHPKIEFLPELGLNNIRTYTLSSWDPENRHLDLCVSIVKNGLTSTYFQTHPEYVRIRTVPSTFYIPEEKRPIVMIANGSGIAPFRSIAQYVAALPAEERPYLRLYYGIQNSDIDFYFGQEWRELERKKIVDVRLAESRRDPTKKQYVQNVLEKDVQWLCDHLFKQNGVIFMCGGTGMSKDVNNVIFKSLVIHTTVPYKAFSLSSQLKQKKVIVEEIFG